MTQEERKRVSAEMVSLREYFESLLSSQRLYFESKLEGFDEAVKVRADALDRRLEGLNELRGVVTDNASRLITREAVELMFNAHSIDINDLKKSRDVLAGKADTSAVNRANMFSIIGIAIGLVSLLSRFIK